MRLHNPFVSSLLLLVFQSFVLVELSFCGLCIYVSCPFETLNYIVVYVVFILFYLLPSLRILWHIYASLFVGRIPQKQLHGFLKFGQTGDQFLRLLFCKAFYIFCS